MSDFDCECGFDDDPICKCNGGPGYGSITGGTKKKNNKPSRPTTGKDVLLTIVSLFVFAFVLGILLLAFGELTVTLGLIIIVGIWLAYTN